MRHYGASNLTPLDPNSLQQVKPKGADWSSLINGDHAYVMDSGTLRIFNWVAASTRAEVLPHVVIPDGNSTGTGRWEQQEFMGAGSTFKEIWTLDDFNPSGGIITLDGHYQIKDTINIGTNRFVFAPGSPTILFDFDDSFNNWIEHTGNSMTLFSGAGALRLLHGRGTTFYMSGNDVTFVDIVGSFGGQYTYVEWTGTGGIIGSVRNKKASLATAGLLLKESLFIGWEDGITVTGGDEISARDVFADASPLATGSFLTIKGASGRILLAKECAISIPSGASFIDIDPTIESIAALTNVFIRDGGSFFHPSTKSGIFTAVANASIGATNITNVVDSGGTARFEFTGPTLYVGQEVVISGFVTNADYNGTWIIESTNGTNYFEIGVDFDANESGGSFLSNSVTVTEAGTTAANGDIILMRTTLAVTYDTGTYVYNKQTNSFQINATWVQTESGTWRNGSLTEQSKYVTVRDCGEQKDSKNLSSVYVNGNVATTNSTSGNWVPINLGTATDSSNSSRFKLVNAGTGEIEYTGRNAFGGILSATISAVKAGGLGVLHQFRVFKTVGTPAFESNILAERTLTDQLGNLMFVSPVNLSPGDRFQMQIKAIGTSTTTTIRTIVTSVQ